MLHIVTVHWHDDRWIDPQLQYIDRFVTEDCRVYACLNGISQSYNDRFHYVCDLDGSHHEKLNALAEYVCSVAQPEDQLLFLDSDAFPIAPLGRSLLDGQKLVAVRRDENMGEQQPHPCFCLTTVGFWCEIDGDWRRGHHRFQPPGRKVWADTCTPTPWRDAFNPFGPSCDFGFSFFCSAHHAKRRSRRSA